MGRQACRPPASRKGFAGFAESVGRMSRSRNPSLKLEDRVTDNLKITVPVALTLAQIARANQDICDDEALKLAQELHALIDAVQTAYIVRPPSPTALAARLPEEHAHLPYEDAIAFDVAEVVDTLRRSVLGFLPPDWNEACSAGEWLMERLTDLGDDSLYDRYLRLCSRISEPGVHAAREIVEAAFTRPPTTHAETDTRTAFSVKPAVCPCGCGDIFVYLYDEQRRAFARFSLAPGPYKWHAFGDACADLCVREEPAAAPKLH
jgi:hypothetical protein